MRNKNDTCIDTLVIFVSDYKASKEKGIKYLIGQTIRQYVIDESHCHYTEGFEKLWNTLTDEAITGSYTETYKYKGDEDITLRCYTGSSHSYKEKTIKKGKKFKWNDIFHYEHTTTVSSIVDSLCSLKTVNHDTVKEVLDGMHITRMTKEENISLHNSNKRDRDFESVVKNLYNANGVYLVK